MLFYLNPEGFVIVKEHYFLPVPYLQLRSFVVVVVF